MKFIMTIIILLLIQHYTYANTSMGVNTPSPSLSAERKSIKAFPSVITLGQIKASNKAKNSVIQQQTLDFLKPIYQRLGIELKTSSLPSKRSLSFSNQGQLDGELLRVHDIDKSYSDLIAVPITLYEIHAYAYTIKGKVDFKEASEILQFTVGINRGIEWEESFAAQYPHNISKINGTKRKFTFLHLGRVEYVISSEQRAQEIIKKYFPNDNIKRVSPMLPKIKLIHYLHKKHAHIIPRLLEEIKKQQHLLPLIHQI